MKSFIMFIAAIVVLFVCLFVMSELQEFNKSVKHSNAPESAKRTAKIIYFIMGAGLLLIIHWAGGGF